MKRTIAAPFVALFVLCAPGVASAGLFRTYLSSTGSDSNDCTLPHPCRLLPAALAAADDGGEVWMLDSANYNTSTVNVTKSVTILAIPGALGSLVAPFNADALQIDPGASSVTLRNLVVRDLAGGSSNTIGIDQLTASSLRIENCEVYGVAAGVQVTNGGSATIVNTAIHDIVAAGILATGSVRASIDGASVSNSGTAVEAGNGARVTVSNSTLTENGLGIYAVSTVGTGTVVDVARSTISSTAASDTGFEINATSGLTAQIFVHSTTIHADTGFFFFGSGGSEQIFTYGDNRVVFYSHSVLGGSLTSVSGI